MKKTIMTAAIAALLAGCGSSETKTGYDTAASPPATPPAAKAACEPPPEKLVTKDLKVGDGRTAIPLATAMVFYTGWLYDACAPDHKGKQFDSNEGKPAPFGFRVGAGRTIRGWDEGVVGMKEGGKRMLIIPSNMAYGEREIPGKIPPHSPLVFEVTMAQLVGNDYAPRPAPAGTPGASPKQ